MSWVSKVLKKSDQRENTIWTLEIDANSSSN